MRKKLLLFFLLISYNQAYSQVIVEDIANLPHNILSSVKAAEMVANQIKNYNLAVEEFELLVKNSAAPYFFIYDKAQNFDENVDRLEKRFSQFTNPNEVDKYFKKYYDVNWYRSSPCFQMGGCSKEELALLAEAREERIKTLTEISTNIKKDMTEWKNQQKERYNIIDTLNKKVTEADGQLKLSSYQAQYLSENTSILTEINQNLRSYLDYVISMNEKNIIKDNINNSRTQSYQEWQAPKIKKWNRNFLD